MAAGQEIDGVLREAASKGLAAEAVMQAITTAMAVMQHTDFGDWRAWADARGWTSGPRTEHQFLLHGAVLAMIAEGLVK